MPKRSSKKLPVASEEPPADVPVGSEVEGVEPPVLTPDGKNAAAVALGRLGGNKGGPARARKLTKEQRSEIAKKAAQARWSRASKSS